MARDRDTGFFAEPEVVYDGGMSVPDLGGWSLQNFQNQFVAPPVDLNIGGLGNMDFSNLNLGNFDLGAFQQQYGAAGQLYQPQLQQPAYQQPTPQPTSAIPYVETPSAIPQSSFAVEPTYQQPTPQAVQTAPYYEEPVYQQPTAQPVTAAPYYDDYSLQQSAQMGALPTAQTAATGALSANSPPPGTTWGVYSTPNDPASQYTVNFMNSKKGAMPLTVSADTPVILYDNKTKQVLASGVGKEGADAVAAAVYKLNQDPKGSSYWDIYTGPAGATDPSQFSVAVSDAQDKNFGQRFVNAVGTMLPVAVSFIPGLGQASLLTKIGAGAAAGAGSAALKGQDILKGAVIGGATSGLVNANVLPGGKSLSGVVGGALNDVPIVGDALRGISDLAKGGGSVYDPASNLITTTATTSAAPALISGGLNSYLSNALNIAKQAPGTVNYGDRAFGEALDEQPGWEVRAPEGSAVIPPALSFDGTGLPPSTGPDIIAEGSREPTIIPPPASLPDLSPPLNSVDIPPLAGTEYPEIPSDDNEIVVTGRPTLPIFPPISFPSVGGLPNVPTTQPTDTGQTTDQKKDTTLDQIIKYLQLAGLGIGTIGSLFGNKGGTGALTGMRGSLSPVFGSSLPAPSLAVRTPRSMSGIDWYRYGYGPEQSFFTNVPEGAANTSRAYTGYADGGYAVGGPGDGRADKIPAMLSDGEYVIDAETVAMLGNGSSKAGAEALDKFRVNIRKHKGRKLSKGEFSVNAKKPEQYLKGRK